ncbi:homoserine kinase [Pilimelia columellifera]|uniref:Homoserine kinase n=1 Tax=Pilimelia columellifera subsp. columellifera TaxID=706583 RepID=A0ABN3NHA2_9ACTN
MTIFGSGEVVVRAPATSANLGPGFDALGLALACYDEVRVRVVERGVTVVVAGEGADAASGDEGHLVARAMLAAFDALGARPPGLSIRCVNAIPQARGLGSSSAAIISGLLAARALTVGGADRHDDADLLDLAARMEGHPDNVAACLLGGVTIAWRASSPARPRAFAARLTPVAGLAPTVFVPAERGLTAHARAALPATVPHADAAFNAGRSALLSHALVSAPELLFAATEDRLHQRRRAAEMPATAALVTRLRALGVAAVVSGAGPSVLALSPPPEAFDPGPGWQARQLPVDGQGAQVAGP